MKALAIVQMFSVAHVSLLTTGEHPSRMCAAASMATTSTGVEVGPQVNKLSSPDITSRSGYV